jgi:pyruvate kinase
MRQTKIVVTLGPACEGESTLRALIEAGADVLRLNFSHGTHEQHARNIKLARRLASECGRTIALMQDLQGPKIRVNSLRGGSVRLRSGADCVISPMAPTGSAERFSTTYPRLARDIRPGQAVLLDDGAMELRVVAIKGEDVTCQVVRGGVLHDRKGMNLPGVRIVAPALTAKDRADLRFGLSQKVDLVALSFVRSPKDAAAVRREMERAGRPTLVIAKIEKPEALDQLDKVLYAFDGAMVARGDLGVELPPEQVPGEQKRIIARANALGRPVITATQMLESMTRSARPTRAEASDVANAVLDGTDAVMLSGETAIGKYPIDAVRAMDRIVIAAEILEGRSTPMEASTARSRGHTRAVCAAAAQLAQEIRADAIAAYTRSGNTARTLSQLRPGIPIIALCEDEATAIQLTLWHGVQATAVGGGSNDEVIQRVARELLARRLVPNGAQVVMVGASPESRAGVTNFVRIVRVRAARQPDRVDRR